MTTFDIGLWTTAEESGNLLDNVCEEWMIQNDEMGWINGVHLKTKMIILSSF